MKIQSKFTLIIAAISLMSILTLGTIIYFSFSNSIASQTEASALSLAEKEKHGITELIEKEEIRTDIFAEKESLLRVLSGKQVSGDIKSINELLAKYVKDNPTLESISIFDKNAVVVANSDPSLIGKSFSDKEYASKTLSTGKAQVSGTLISDLTGKPVVMFTRPVIDPDNDKTIGFVGIPLYVEFLAEQLLNAKINNSKSSTAFIIDRYGNYIYTPDSVNLGKPNDIKEVSNIAARLQKGEHVQSSKITYESGDQKMTGAYSIVDKTDWILVVAAQESEFSASLTQIGMFLMVAEFIIVLFASLAGFIFARRISKPIICISENLDQLALGDLDVDIPKSYLKYTDEIGKLSLAMQNIVSSLHEKSLAAEKIANGDSSVEQVRKLAMEVKDSADNGNMQMGEMITAMNDINISSGNISKIIKVIDEIAFQTNILALNAAVEAARAGQHGKGFAVVAEEVRNLAARSASAAKETTMLIESSIKKTTDGMKIANDTANALSTIVDGISKTSDLLNEIANATNEQASAISQINTGVTQVSQVTQHNSAIAQESAAASEEISGQAEVLKYLVGNFKLKNTSNYHNSGKSMDVMDLNTLGQTENKSEIKKTKSGKNKSKSLGQKSGIILNDNDFGKY